MENCTFVHCTEFVSRQTGIVRSILISQLHLLLMHNERISILCGLNNSMRPGNKSLLDMIFSYFLFPLLYFPFFCIESLHAVSRTFVSIIGMTK